MSQIKKVSSNVTNTAARSGKRLTNKMKAPIVELSDCIVCGVCVETCPEVFRLNDAGYIEVIELAVYPESEVNDAIKYCPVDCIHWST
jgi:ferredoxin